MIAQERAQEIPKLFLWVQSVTAGRRAQRRLNFRTLPQVHLSLCRTACLEALLDGRLPERLVFSLATITGVLDVAGKLLAPIALMIS